MLIDNEDELKKKKEEARQLRNSFGMVTDNDKKIYGNDNFSFSDSTSSISNKHDSEDFSTTQNNSYSQRLEEAKKIRNSFGMTTTKDSGNDDFMNFSKDDDTITTIHQKDDNNISGTPKYYDTNIDNIEKTANTDTSINENTEKQGESKTKKTDNNPSITRKVEQPSYKNISLSVANPEQTKNAKPIVDYTLQQQKEEKDSQNIFVKAGTWIKDLFGSIGVSIKNTATGLYKTAKEGYDERKEAVDNMSESDIQNSSNKNKILADTIAPNTFLTNTNNNENLNSQKTKLIINDTIQDVSRSTANGLIGIANNVLNFLTFGTLSKDTIKKIPDFSVLQNSEQYGEYSSQEELTNSIQNDKKQDLADYGLYNPSANAVADITVDIAEFLLLKKAGLGSTSAMVTSGTANTLGETGNVEDATKSAVSNYVFSKVLDNKLINEKLGNAVFNGTKGKVVEALGKHGELLDADTQMKIVKGLSSASATFSETFVSRILTNELQAVGDYGNDVYNKDVQKNILVDGVIWSAIYAGISGFSGAYAKVDVEQSNINDAEAKRQLENCYSIMELDSSKEYTIEELNKQRKELVKKYHPDLAGGSNEKMATINNAYDVLNKYITEGVIDKVVIHTESSNTPPKEDNIKEKQNGMVVTKDGQIYVDSNDILKQTATNIAKSQISPAITTIVDKDNNLTGLEQVNVVPFEVENSKVPTITPAIYVSDDGSINVIDTNTGTKLLTNAKDADTAIETVTKALQSNDESNIRNIENEVTKNSIQVEQAIGNIIDKINEKTGENNAPDISQENQDDYFSSTFGNMPNINEDSPENSFYGSSTSYIPQEQSVNIEANNAIKNLSTESTENYIKPENHTNMGDRTYENVGNKKVLPYQTENPEISQDIKDMAANFMEDLAYSIPGERYKAGDTWTGQKRSTTKELANFKDLTGASWDKISKVLNDIYDGNGNYALAKKMELELDQALSEGYTNIHGKVIMPNNEYLKKKSKIEGKNYLSIEENGDYVPDSDTRILGMTQNTSKIKKQKKLSETKQRQFNEIIENAMDNKNAKGSITLAKVDEETAIRIKDLTGIDTLHRNERITASNIRHILKQHGDKNIEINKGQIAITKKDLKKIPDVIANFDKIEKGNINKDRNGEHQTVKFIKEYNNSTIYVVEVVPNKSKTLTIKTMWKKQIGLNHSNNALLHTSKTKTNIRNSTFINNSITQNNKSVKNTAITNNSMQKMKKNTSKKDSIIINEEDEAFYVKNNIKKSIYFRFDDKNEFRGKDHQSGMSTWKDNVIDKISDNLELGDSEEGIEDRNRLLEKYGVTQKQYDDMSLEEEDKIQREIALDEGWITNGASVFNLTKDGLEWFENYERYHHLTEYDEVNFFTGKVTGEGIDGEDVVIPDDEILLKMNSKDFSNILEKIEDKYDDFENPNINKEFLVELVKLINQKLNKNNYSNNDIKIAKKSTPQRINNEELTKSNDDIRYMKKSGTLTQSKKLQETDNKGRKLSEQQQGYFKNSKVRDNNGNLKVVYHGTDADFTVFNYDYLGKNGTANGKGFYLADDINVAKSYSNGKNLIEAYVDIQKPLSIGKTTMSENDYIKFVKAVNDKTNGTLFADYGDGEKLTKNSKEYNDIVNQFKEEYKYGGDDVDLALSILNSANIKLEDGYRLLRNTTGYDGIIVPTNYKDNGKDIPYTQYIPLTPEQIKNVDNTSPTNNVDIRYLKSLTSQDSVSKINVNNIPKAVDTELGKTNAEREDSYIEKEIQKVESKGNWDNSIPVTKLSDINKTIEDYLQLKIKKGRFRQDAYGIYKDKRDVLRVQEYKDIDTALHEAGHAMDLGKRINVDKESISEELLNAIDKYGGYEGEPRSIKLDEGFAEVIREYGIKPEEAKKDYPNTIAILENMRMQDKSFDDFISKVQEMTYNYIHQSPRNRTLSNLSVGEQTDKKIWNKKTIKTEIMRNVFDSDYALKVAVSDLAKASGKKVSDIKATENAYILTRLASGIGERVTSILADGLIDENGEKRFEGLNKIGDILGKNPERYNDLRAYLVAQRDTEYKARTLRTGIRSMDSQSVINQFKNDSQIKEASKIIYNALDGVLQYAVDNHLLTSENAEALRESNAFYVPMQRVLENDRGNNVGNRGRVNDIIKKRTGSELDVKDVLENIISNSSNIIRQVENNNVLKALYKQGEESGLTGAVYDVIPAPMFKVGTQTLATWEKELKRQGVNTENLDLQKSIDIFSPSNKVDSKNLITSFIDDNGKRKYLQFYDEDVFNNLMGMDRKFMSKILSISSKLNMPLRFGATMGNIGFAIPNMISDTAQAAVYSTAGFIPVVDNAIGVLNILAVENKHVEKFLNQIAPEYTKKVNFMYELYKQSGAPSSTRLSQYRKSTQSIMNEIYGTKSSTLGIKESFKPLKRTLDMLSYIPDISEQSTRFRVYQKNYNYYKRKGNSEMDSRIMAAIESRDATQDFGRTGNITKEVNQAIPFSAARVGSSYTFAEKVSDNPKKVGFRIAMLTATALAISAMGYNSTKIQELNQRKKDDNFVFDIGDNVITIKKPQGVLRSIINLAEYIQDLATGHIEEGKEGERLGTWLNNAIMDNMPADEVTGLVPNAVAPLIENAINKDFYYNTDIVKSYDLDLPESEQYYDYNSQLSKWIGSIFNYSPAKIDNLISGYFGGLGTSVTNTIDYVLGKMGVIPEQVEMGAERNSVGKRFFANVNSNSKSLDELYNTKDELTKKKNGGTITSEETKQLEKINEASSQIADINKKIKSIKSDEYLDGQEKAEKIKALQSERTDTARQALGKELMDTSNKTRIESTKFYPSNSTLKQNKYTLTLTDEMKNEYERIAYERYSQYSGQGLYNEDYLQRLETKCKDYAKNYMMQKYKSQLVKSK